MDNQITLIVLWTLLAYAFGQYNERGGPQLPNSTPASILLHKQALGQDGSFNYAFAADNGLRQGEIINPDGSRKGSYSYVDPNGKTVSLSYTAGKDGFRVLNGDHVPKAPEPQRASPGPYHPHSQLIQKPPPQYPYQHQHQHQHQPQPYHHLAPSLSSYPVNPVPYDAYRSEPNAPAYRPNPVPLHEPRHPSPHIQPQALAPYVQAPPRPPQYNVQETTHDKPFPYPAHYHQLSRPREETLKPHSFGNGFAFEFAG